MLRKLLLTLGGIIVFLLSIGGFALWESKEPKLAIQSSPLFELFNNERYEKIIKRLDSANKILLVGKHEEGFKSFIDYYLSLDSTRTQYNVKKRSLSSLYLEYAGNPVFGIVSEFIKNKIL